MHGNRRPAAHSLLSGHTAIVPWLWPLASEPLSLMTPSSSLPTSLSSSSDETTLRPRGLRLAAPPTGALGAAAGFADGAALLKLDAACSSFRHLTACQKHSSPPIP